jgi:urease accessory protein
LQRTSLHLEPGARLEWLPLEAILYTGCIAENRLTATLADGSQMIGWDVTSLGLPSAGLAFLKGSFCQHIEFPGQWLERGRIAADDHRLLASPLGFGGQTCIATLFFAAGNPLERHQKDGLLDAARACVTAHPLQAQAGVTSAGPRLVVLRVLAPRVEPAMELLRQVWMAWRGFAWGKPASMPRIWAT